MQAQQARRQALQRYLDSAVARQQAGQRHLLSTVVVADVREVRLMDAHRVRDQGPVARQKQHAPVPRQGALQRYRAAGTSR